LNGMKFSANPWRAPLAMNSMSGQVGIQMSALINLGLVSPYSSRKTGQFKQNEA